jgi:hypothetical protein
MSSKVSGGGPVTLGVILHMATPHVTKWTPAPELAIPDLPALLADSNSLWLAYATTAEPRGQMYAVVRFNDVIDHRLSPINDEGIGKHPYARVGLQWYAFNEVIDSAEAIEWRALKARHWVITFKDNTLDVLAESADVVVQALRASDPVSVLLSTLQNLGVTCFRFFGQCDSLFWTAHQEPSDVKAGVEESL